MKWFIASDIHGSAYWCRKMLEAFENENADRLLILGDILYHGPRNDLPTTYAPKEVIALLNQYKDVILAVRGNCDAEVDQMVLSFPILADYCILSLDGITVYATHGHKFNTDSLPPLSRGDVLLHGHTHLLCCEKFGEDNVYLNPGSVALPKGGNPRSYMLYENGTFTCVDLSGNVLFQHGQ